MFQPLPLPCAITRHGELVTAANIQQEDYEGLFCEHCHVRIGILPDWRKPYGRVFYHSPTRLEDSRKVETCCSQLQTHRDMRYSLIPVDLRKGLMLSN